MDNFRECNVTFSELIDRLVIDQIKEMRAPEKADSVGLEINRLIHDIDLAIKDGEIKLNARLLRLIVILAQINLHIWYAKEQMMSAPSSFEEEMVLAHQLNGIRNQVKNILQSEYDASEKNTPVRTNISTDGLKGWTISI